MASKFETFMRTGELHEDIVRDEEGRVLAPDLLTQQLAQAMREVSPMRNYAQVQTLTVPLDGEKYAMPAGTGALLEDSIADFNQWFINEVKSVFAAQEQSGFILGDGVDKPRGILLDGDKCRKGIVQGEINIDALIAMIYALPSKLRREAVWYMNRRTISEIRKLKDADGNYIWMPSPEVGTPSSLLGYPLVEVEDMPDIDSKQPCIMFAELHSGYLIQDGQSVKILRDPYSAKPYILFYTTQAVGGKLKDGDSICLLTVE